MNELVTFGVISFSAIFVVVDPLAALPMFLALTRTQTPAEQRLTAWRASVTCCLTLTLFAAAGGLIFRFFGISLGAFKVAGGAVLFLLALDMMQARPSRTKTTPEEQLEGVSKNDVSIVPLAIPLLSGPGAMATVMVLMSRHHEWIYGVPVLVAIVLTGVATWLTLRGASWIEARLSHTFMNALVRVMGLILAAVAVEFIAAGAKDLLVKMRVGG